MFFSGIKSGDKHIIPESIMELSKFCENKLTNSDQVMLVKETLFNENSLVDVLVTQADRIKIVKNTLLFFQLIKDHIYK